MLAQIIRGVLVRDALSFRVEILAYEDEGSIWRLVPGILNSPGTLALHVAGNLQHYIGAMLGSTGYVRDRNAEFSRRDVPRAELLAGIDSANVAVDQTLAQLPEEKLAEEFPEPVANVRVTTGDFLVHLASHLGYHLGQVDYHRRITTGQSNTVGALSISRLKSARKVG